MATVAEVAAARGRSVDEVLAVCRAAGVIAWSANAPLDVDEIATLDAALSAPPPPAFAPIGAAPGGPPPPPPTGPPATHLPPPPMAAPVAGGFHMPPVAPKPRRVSGLVRAGVVAGGLLLIVGRIGLNLVLDGVGDDRQRDAAADDIREALGSDFEDDLDDAVAPFALVVGDCFDDRSDGVDPTEVVDARLEEVDCGLPHDAEVYAVVHHPDPADAPYAGDDALVGFARTECVSRFEAFVGVPYGTSSLDFMFTFPSPRAWDWLDERTVVCAVYAIDGVKLTASVAGTGV